ncbi:hypothetical protein [Streptacidiphilus sp. EB103A]|uniref:hypothetical protein n=1 Tax=Streptacidiphilus sp. EB103A TaxID=3156275 RepID=UPI003518E109
MSLVFISKDPGTDGANCPTVWVDPESQEIVVQGWKADAAMTAECLTVGSIPDTEAVVRLPARLVAALREACDVAERSAVR